MSGIQKGAVTPHTHCRICGKPIPLGRDYCSNECRDKEVKTQGRSRKMSQVYNVIFIVIMVVILLFAFLSSPR